MHRRYAIGGLYSGVQLRNFAKRSHERLSHWQIAEILFPLSPTTLPTSRSLTHYHFLSLSLPFSFSLVSGANQTPPRRRFELFPRPETSTSTDVLQADWKIRKFAVRVGAKERTSRERTGNDDWLTQFRNARPCSPESRRMSRSRISSRSADRQRGTR